MARVDNNVIIENLTQLLTNTVNMTSVFYDIFLNPEQMDVELQQYNAEGQLITISIPNRAKDRRIAIVGQGSPEGRITANVGTVYVNEEPSVEDTNLNGRVYFKVNGSGNTGWVTVFTEEGVNDYLRSYLEDNKFMTEADTDVYMIREKYTTEAKVSDMLEQYKPTIYMTTLPNASGTIHLADNTGYAITVTGNVIFEPPTITDLNILHKIFIQLYVSGSYTVTLSNNTIYYFDNIEPVFASGSMYNVMYEYDNNRNVWVVGAMSKGAA